MLSAIRKKLKQNENFHVYGSIERNYGVVKRNLHDIVLLSSFKKYSTTSVQLNSSFCRVIWSWSGQQLLNLCTWKACDCNYIDSHKICTPDSVLLKYLYLQKVIPLYSLVPFYITHHTILIKHKHNNIIGKRNHEYCMQTKIKLRTSAYNNFLT